MSAPVPNPDSREVSWDDELRRAEAVALRRLCQLAEAADPRLALRACEVIVKAVAGARRERTRSRPGPTTDRTQEPSPAPVARPVEASAPPPSRGRTPHRRPRTAGPPRS